MGVDYYKVAAKVLREIFIGHVAVDMKWGPTPFETQRVAEMIRKEIEMANRLMQFFEYTHLPEHLQVVSKPLCDVAKHYDEAIAESAEKTAGLRKLLEAKDCMVRAALEQVGLV